MKTLLAALHEGRLIELPENNKEKALQFLGSLIEAIPDLKAGTQVVESVLARERTTNTGLGLGWACPHARTANDGELLCAVGWSPAGIDYGASDGLPVHLVVMYYIPDAQRNAYLKEISSLARILSKPDGLSGLAQAQTRNEVRIRLLEVISAAIESDVPASRAHMVRIEARQAAIAAAVPASLPENIVPLAVVTVPGRAPLILAQNREVVAALEAASGELLQLAHVLQADVAGYRIIVRQSATYQPDRVLYDCLAFKLPTPPVPKLA